MVVIATVVTGGFFGNLASGTLPVGHALAEVVTVVPLNAFAVSTAVQGTIIFKEKKNRLYKICVRGVFVCQVKLTEIAVIPRPAAITDTSIFDTLSIQ